jgi:hypothetical protein
MFVFGALIAFCALGLTTDLLLKGNFFYNSLLGFIVLEILFLSCVVIFDSSCDHL